MLATRGSLMRINLLVSSRSHSAGQLKQEIASPPIPACWRAHRNQLHWPRHSVTVSPRLGDLALLLRLPASSLSLLPRLFFIFLLHLHSSSSSSFPFLLLHLFSLFNFIPHSHPPAAAPSSQPHHPHLFRFLFLLSSRSISPSLSRAALNTL